MGIATGYTTRFFLPIEAALFCQTIRGLRNRGTTPWLRVFAIPLLKACCDTKESVTLSETTERLTPTLLEQRSLYCDSTDGVATVL